MRRNSMIISCRLLNIHITNILEFERKLKEDTIRSTLWHGFQVFVGKVLISADQNPNSCK